MKEKNRTVTSGSIYKYVQKQTQNGIVKYCITYPKTTRKRYDTEKEAGIAIDKILISLGKEPVNVLIKEPTH